MTTYITDTTTAKLVDLYEDFPVEINYNAMDLSAINPKTSTVSKTVSVPYSKNNEYIFNQFGINYNISSSFNPNKAYNFSLDNNGVPIFDGNIKLLDVTRNINNDITDFNIQLASNVVNLSDKLGNTYLNDLTTLTPHTLNSFNVISASWYHTSSDVDNYVYLPIDYGNISTNGNSSYIPYEQFFPGIYAKTILDAIFDEAGFTYSSSLFDSEQFKKVIIPWTCGTGSATNYLGRSELGGNCKLYGTPDIAAPWGSYMLPAKPPTETTYNNIYSSYMQRWNYNPGAFVGYSIVPSTPVTMFQANFPGTYYLDVNMNMSGTSAAHECYFEPWVSDSPLFSSEDHTTPSAYGNPVLLVNGINHFQVPIELKRSTSQIYVVIKTKYSGPIVADGTIDFKLNDPNATTLVEPAKILPYMKQVDFLKHISTMFNLIWTPDKDILNRINIEPYPTFYNDNAPVKDWTQKVDLNSVKVTPTTDVDTTKTFKFKDDDDRKRKEYLLSGFEDFGSQTYYADNDFDTSEVIETGFASTVGSIEISNMYFPSILNDEGDANTQKWEPRILYYGGLQPTSASFYYGVEGKRQIAQNYGKYPYCGHSLYQPKTAMYTSSLNRELNFGTVMEHVNPGSIYDSTPLLSNNTLYNLYWDQYNTDIHDGLIVEYDINVTPNDINQLKLNDIIFIKDTYFQLISLQYDAANSDGLAKIKLLKVIRDITLPRPAPIPWVPQPRIFPRARPGIWGPRYFVDGYDRIGTTGIGSIQYSRIGGNNSVWVGDHIAAYDTNTSYIAGNNLGLTSINNSTVVGSGSLVNNTQTSIIYGNYNTVTTSSNLTLFGNNNYISESSSNLVVFGNSYTASAGTVNTAVFNNMSITASDFYLQGSGSLLSIISSSIASGSTLPGGANTNIQYNDNGLFGGDDNFKWNTNIFSLTAGSSSLSNGTASIALGYMSTATGNYGSSAIGHFTLARGQYGSHAEGDNTVAYGDYSHAEGHDTISSGSAAHSEGKSTQAIGNFSHVEGESSIASGVASHAEGEATEAIGNFGHAEGWNTQAIGEGSHAENYYTIASGPHSHAQGYQSIASGSFSHASGKLSVASGDTSFVHSSGSNCSHANSAIIGGIGITSIEDNMVYVPAIEIASGSTAKIIMTDQVDGLRYSIVLSGGTLIIELV